MFLLLLICLVYLPVNISLYNHDNFATSFITKEDLIKRKQNDVMEYLLKGEKKIKIKISL